jgi:hypothetical protein
MIAVLKFNQEDNDDRPSSSQKMIAILKFNQQDDSDRIHKYRKNQIITVNHNQLSRLRL